ncbi:hypothetical protein FHETE_10621 [Fusarium heterosporum]|uniref:Uncharacterized protein n=1 Tax=Fusarium heterosporum TaxID=42747 RepID=A0A8H5SU59_FUSHE|nr:hypothetical protein FHETE_10621 [Fusarium heterosporum]
MDPAWPCSPGPSESLFSPYLENCQLGDYKHLRYDNIAKVPEGDKPKQSMFLTSIFQDNENRTAALVAGAREELEMQDQRSRFLAEQKIPIVVLENTFSRWIPEKNDIDRYGITPNGCVTHYFGVIALDPHISSAFPDVNESFSLFTAARWGRHGLPSTGLTPEQSRAVALHIVSAFQLGEFKASNKQEDIDDEIAAAADDEGKVTWLSEQAESLVLECFIGKAAKALFNVLREPSANEIELYKGRDDQLVHTAIVAAKQLQRDNYSGDIEWSEGILACVVKFGGPDRFGKMHELGPEYRTKRIALPYGTKANVALISVSMPAVKVVGELHNFLNTLFTPGSTTKGTNKIVKAKDEVPFVVGTILRDVNPKTIAFECDAPSRLDSREDSLSSKFWTYSMAFQSSPDVYNFLKAFPGLAASFENGEFDSEARRVVQALLPLAGRFNYSTNFEGNLFLRSSHDKFPGLSSAFEDGKIGDAPEVRLLVEALKAFPLLGFPAAIISESIGKIEFREDNGIDDSNEFEESDDSDDNDDNECGPTTKTVSASDDNLAEQKACNIRTSVDEEIGVAIQWGEADKVEYLKDTIGDKALDAFINVAAQIVCELVRSPTESVAHMLRAPPTEQRAHTTKYVAL